MGISEPKIGNVLADDTISRNPKDYQYNQHVVNQKKERDVDGWIFKHLIENGQIQSEPSPNNYLFVAEIPTMFDEHEWVLPVVQTINSKKNQLKTAPYIRGLSNEEIAELNPIQQPATIDNE